MKKLAIAMMVVSAAAVAVESFAASGAEDAIKRVYAQLDVCASKSDAKCIADLFTDDGTFSEPASGGKIIKGQAQILKTLQDLMSGAPNTKGLKHTRLVENVRMIGADHALVDSSLDLKGMESAEAVPGNGPREHSVAVMILRGDKWLFEDIRSYVVGAAWPTKKDTAPAAKPESSPAAKSESAPAAKPEPAQAEE
jgi:uncharacterized protein (TIGR02246 family)